jgi:aspartate aminotransferase-like enzyme
MGYLSPEDMVNVISALELTFRDLKYDINVGRAVEKADDILFGDYNE